MIVEMDGQGEMVQVGDAWVQERVVFTVRYEERGAPEVARAVVEVRHGRHEVVEVTLKASPTGRGLVNRDILPFTSMDSLSEAAGIMGPSAASGRYAAIEQRVKRRRGTNPEELERVADVYKSNPSAPVVAVERELDVSLRTAARRVAAARAAGLLPAREEGSES